MMPKRKRISISGKQGLIESLDVFSYAMSPDTRERDEIVVQILLNLALKFEKMQERVIDVGNQARYRAYGPTNHRIVFATVEVEATSTVAWIGLHHKPGAQVHNYVTKMITTGKDQHEVTDNAISIMMELAIQREKKHE